MLVLSCKPGDIIQIGDNIFVKLLESSKFKSRIGFQAPAEVMVSQLEKVETRGEHVIPLKPYLDRLAAREKIPA